MIKVVPLWYLKTQHYSFFVDILESTSIENTWAYLISVPSIWSFGHLQSFAIKRLQISSNIKISFWFTGSIVKEDVGNIVAEHFIVCTETNLSFSLSLNPQQFFSWTFTPKEPTVKKTSKPFFLKVDKIYMTWHYRS